MDQLDVRLKMELPYIRKSIDTASLLYWLVPVLLGAVRGFTPKAGNLVLLASLAALSTWTAGYFVRLAELWNEIHLGIDDSTDTSDGAANVFVALLGWFPGLVLFCLTLASVGLFFRWIPRRIQRTRSLEGSR